MQKNNKGNKGSNKQSTRKSIHDSQIRSTAVNPSSGPKPKQPAKQPK